MDDCAQRLVVNAEDVAFNDPPAGAAEQMILNRHLQRLLRHARLSAFQRFIQQARARCLSKASSCAVSRVCRRAYSSCCLMVATLAAPCKGYAF